MIRQKTFVKKTRTGKILKVVREHYLRTEIPCGVSGCKQCIYEDIIAPQALFPNENASKSSLIKDGHILAPDTNVVLHQFDALSDPTLCSVLILQTVLEEVRHRSVQIFKKLKELIADEKRHFYVLTNEFHKDMYIERQPKESANDRNDRAIRQAVKWLKDHLNGVGEVVLLTGDQENRVKAQAGGLRAFTLHEYVGSLTNADQLREKLASVDVGPKETLYPAHLPLSDVKSGIQSGKFVQGKFSRSRENATEGWVTPSSGGQQILVQGHDGLNRAMQEDIVALQLLPESEWSKPSGFIVEDADDAKEKKDNDKSEKDSDRKSGKEKDSDRKSEKVPTGKVVGIIRRGWRQYCGILQPSDLAGAIGHLVIPAERCIPKIRIETRQATRLSGQRIVVAIDSWPQTSRYPLGHFVRALGNVGDRDAENEVLLLEHDIPHAPFSTSVLSCLPPTPWSITDEEREKRRDLRHIPVCSVDPPGCTDIDDALHCLELEPGRYQVGVHIADVSHFIRPSTAIDREAAHRGTTVYLVDQRIDMVPELLSSNLCSLRGGEERLAFSAVWEVDDEGQILKEEFHKSIIRSRAALTYAEAQLRIDDPTQKDEVTLGLRRLNSLAKILKAKRKKAGALTLASQEVRFHMDSETHDPVEVQTKQLLETNSMVEEFMLLANIRVATKIQEEFPECALLRRHPAPPAENFEPLIKACLSRGLAMEVTDGLALAASLEKAVDPDNPYMNTILRILCTRCMMQAVYCCSGLTQQADFHHYGLATPIYTHFTSPIRRYADLVVHRLLAVAINADSSYADLLDKKKMQAECYNINYRHRMAQYAGRASVALHTQLFFKNKISEEQGYVLFVRKNALQVLIPRYGLEGILYLPQEIFAYDEERCAQVASNVVIRVFDPLTVQLSLDTHNVQHQKLTMKLVKPIISGFSVDQEEGPPAKKQKT